MPARRLQLKTRDVETRPSGAGHVVAEVWLSQFNKWVFADGQFDVIPERNGKPLDAVEFQDAIASGARDLICRTSSGTDQAEYIDWVSPYLYYFDINIDQRWYGTFQRDQRCIMLVPLGAKNPTVFQRQSPIENCAYISDPELFYAAPQVKEEYDGTK
jgi:hypothetical protein